MYYYRGSAVSPLPPFTPRWFAGGPLADFAVSCPCFPFFLVRRVHDGSSLRIREISTDNGAHAIQPSRARRILLFPVFVPALRHADPPADPPKGNHNPGRIFCYREIAMASNWPFENHPGVYTVFLLSYRKRKPTQSRFHVPRPPPDVFSHNDFQCCRIGVLTLGLLGSVVTYWVFQVAVCFARP